MMRKELVTIKKVHRKETIVENKIKIKQRMFKSSRYTIFSLISIIKTLIQTFNINRINKIFNFKAKKMKIIKALKFNKIKSNRKTYKAVIKTILKNKIFKIKK